MTEQSRLRSLYGTERPVAFVTGSAADRVGRAIARRFAENNYRVVLHAHRSREEGEQLRSQWRNEGYEVELVIGSIADEADVASWMDEIGSKFGRLDVLVHSAAVWEPMRLEETTSALLYEQWSSNTLGTFLCAQHCGLQMVQQASGGSIVLIGDWAIARPYTDFAAYFASKAGIPTLTRTFAIELAERNPNVRVNAILPGPVMLDRNTPEETQKRILEQCLLRRAGTAGHVAQAAIFLAEHEFITGVCLPVDGGRSVYAGSMGDALAHPSLFDPNFPSNRAKPESHSGR